MRSPVSDNILVLDRISIRFGGIQALDEVNLSIERGKIHGIIGPNGAGKTTLFNVITGVFKPASGSIRFNQDEIVGRAPEKICRLGIARTYQKVKPFLRLTVLENVVIPIINRTTWSKGIAAARPLALELLERVDLASYVDVEAGSLSLFHRKKVELARALGAGGTLLLLDEVMAGLTPVECDAAVTLLRALKHDFDLTIVCIEHLMRIMMTLCDQITVLDRGKVIAEGAPADISSSALVQQAYFGNDYA